MSNVMTLADRVVPTLAGFYLVAVTMLGAGLILVGYLIGLTPGIPSALERRYGAFALSVLDMVLHPFDSVSPVA